MLPEDKIATAVDRNTAKIDEFRRDVGSVGMWLFLILIVPIANGCPKAKATTITPPLAQSVLADIGDPPAPPPNPNMQYWYTMDVPGPEGVLPVEVFAPRLVANFASAPGPAEVPEPGTAIIGFVGLLFMVGWMIFYVGPKLSSYHDALHRIAEITDQEQVRNIARKALEE